MGEEREVKRKRFSFWKFLLYFSLFILFIGFLNTIFSSEDKIKDTKPVSQNITLVKEESPAEFKKKCVFIPYKELARNTEKYIGKRVVYKGEVIQIVEEWGETLMRVNVTFKDFYWDDTILVRRKGENKNPRVLEEDIIRVYGIVKGRTSYISVLGAKITLPEIEAKYIEIIR